MEETINYIHFHSKGLLQLAFVRRKNNLGTHLNLFHVSIVSVKKMTLENMK